MIIGKINDKVLIDDLVFREEEHKRIMYVNEMEDYLYNHNYISKNKDKDPFRQQELSVERASCIVQKYRTLTEEKDKEIERLNNIIDKIRMCLLNYTSEYYTNEDKPRKVRMLNVERLEYILQGEDKDE